jgi:predicted O-linked N-acetylglucosamine transferase (SPINDLY family)
MNEEKEASSRLSEKWQQALEHHRRGRLAPAKAAYKQILAIQPRHIEALHLLGVIALQTGNAQGAVQLIEKAIAIKPVHAEAYFNRGLALRQMGQPEAALASYEQAIKLDAHHAGAHFNRANLLKDRHQFEKALAGYDQAIAASARFAEAYLNSGNVLLELQQFDEALVRFNQAIAIKGDYAQGYFCRGNLFRRLKQYEAAIGSYDQAIALKPDVQFLFGVRLHTKMQVCDWSEMDANIAQLTARITRGEAASPPFAMQALSGCPKLHKRVAEIWVREKCPLNRSMPAIPKRAKRGKIKVAYFSADYRNHATSYLIAELFELHDRSQFELTAFSFGPDSRDAMRQRLEAACDHFIDVRRESDREAALLARKLQVDIAVDLMGFTQDSRPGIFASRAAPVQVSYLGYPGTMGAEYMDYLMADARQSPRHRPAWGRGTQSHPIEMFGG